jgi:hypothetical protein
MRRFFVFCFLFSVIGFFANAQTAAPGEVITKKVVKTGTKFFIETKTVKTELLAIDFDVIFLVENDSLNDAQDLVYIDQVKKERDKLKAERQERNKLLKDALKAGYEPDIKTPEQKKRVDAIKSRLK